MAWTQPSVLQRKPSKVSIKAALVLLPASPSLVRTGLPGVSWSTPNRKAAVKPGTTTESGGTLFVKEWENYTKATMMEIHIEGTDITITFFAGGVLIVGVFLGTLLPSFAALGLGNDFNRVTCLLS